jgi:hypothetical protein
MRWKGDARVCGSSASKSGRGGVEFLLRYLFHGASVRRGGRYHAWLLEIMERELPDLVLAERDDDVIALAAIREQHPRFAPGIACGSLGFDQLGLVAHHFAGAQRLAPSPTLGGIGVTVYKSLGDFPVRHEDAAMLKERGVWRRFS